jgi:hypothetical protein
MTQKSDPFEELFIHDNKIKQKTNMPMPLIKKTQDLPIKSRQTIDNRNKELNKMLEKDTANNKLMERLNSELIFRKSGYNKKYFEKPYENPDQNIVSSFNSNDQVAYVTNNNDNDIPITDFSSTRVLKSKY